MSRENRINQLLSELSLILSLAALIVGNFPIVATD